jgi:hypothetical protein
MPPHNPSQASHPTVPRFGNDHSEVPFEDAARGTIVEGEIETTQLIPIGRRSPRIGHPACPDGLFDGFERFLSRESEPHPARHKGESSRSFTPNTVFHITTQLVPVGFTSQTLSLS